MLAATLLAAGCSVQVDTDDFALGTSAGVVDEETPEAAETPTEEPMADPTATPEAAATPTVPSGDADPDDDTAVDDGSSAATPTPAPGSTPSDTAEPTATPAPTPTTPAAPSPTPTVTPLPAPTATPTPVAIEFVVAPNADLLGVAIGAEAETAISALEAAIGAPDFDSGWYQGCPLDGDEMDERLLQWGDLNVYFDRSDGDPHLRAWGYDLRIVDGGFPEIDLIQLPGGAQMGDPVNEVAIAAGLDVVYDDVFEINRVGEPGYELLADAPPGAPVWGAFVPFIPTCE